MSNRANLWCRYLTFIEPGGKLDPYEKGLLLLLCDMANDDTMVCYPSTADIANYTGMSEEGARQKIKSLERRGLITISRERRPNGDWGHNKYRIEMDKFATSQCKEHPSRGGVPTLSHGVVVPHSMGKGVPHAVRPNHNVRTEMENIKETPPHTPQGGRGGGDSASFDSLWSVYPRREKKQAATKAFAKLSPDPDLLKRIIAHVEGMCESERWRKDGGRYIPCLHNYIEGERWEDEGIVIEPEPDPQESWEDAFPRFSLWEEDDPLEVRLTKELKFYGVDPTPENIERYHKGAEIEELKAEQWSGAGD